DGAAKRYFGRGDVLRNANLEFGEAAYVEIESRFEQCSIALGQGAELIIGPNGVLSECQITGGGNITVHGQFYEGTSPGILNPKQLVVSAAGSVVSAVAQPAEKTHFAFEPG